MTVPEARFQRFSWGVLAAVVAVILWGAFVRATGSGAGCGAHWPLCNGEVLPRAPQIETLIELTHRVTSGLSLLVTIGLPVWARKIWPAGHRVRRAAWASLGFMVGEAAVGAMLVMLELTADNDSVLRAWVMGGHLINAFLLLAALTLTAWWSGHDQPLKPGRHPVVAVVVSVALLGMLLLGASGGITALGDTLFPANSLAEGLAMDRSATAHILIKLRVIHPILALAMGAWLAFTVVVCGFSCRKRTVTVLGAALVFTVLLQIGAGFLNLFLMAPVWLQLVHLFLADVVWMLVVVLAAESLCESGLR